MAIPPPKQVWGLLISEKNGLALDVQSFKQDGRVQLAKPNTAKNAYTQRCKFRADGRIQFNDHYYLDIENGERVAHQKLDVGKERNYSKQWWYYRDDRSIESHTSGWFIDVKGAGVGGRPVILK